MQQRRIAFRTGWKLAARPTSFCTLPAESLLRHCSFVVAKPRFHQQPVPKHIWCRMSITLRFHSNRANQINGFVLQPLKASFGIAVILWHGALSWWKFGDTESFKSILLMMLVVCFLALWYKNWTAKLHVRTAKRNFKKHHAFKTNENHEWGGVTKTKDRMEETNQKRQTNN